jgi:hypothetical protein
MSSISRSIAQAIVPAVRRAASTAAPATTQSAKEGFKLVEVRDRVALLNAYQTNSSLNGSVLQVLYAVPPLLAIV